jgi:hypothetical protein
METGNSKLETRKSPHVGHSRASESTSMSTDLDPRLRGGDNNGYFHLVG